MPPRLFRLTSNPYAMVADERVVATEAWDLSLRQNPIDMQTAEWGQSITPFVYF